MQLITNTQISLDGVMQANGPSRVEREEGFERDGWAIGKFGEETGSFITEAYERADAFLFGRRTYEMFAPYWGSMEPGVHPIADALNTKPKYLASGTVTDPGRAFSKGASPASSKSSSIEATRDLAILPSRILKRASL